MGDIDEFTAVLIGTIDGFIVGTIAAGIATTTEPALLRPSAKASLAAGFAGRDPLRQERARIFAGHASQSLQHARSMISALGHTRTSLAGQGQSQKGETQGSGLHQF